MTNIETLNLLESGDLTKKDQPCAFADMGKVYETIEKINQILDQIFIYKSSSNILTINAVYAYDIDLSRIPDFQALAKWVNHLSQKKWMTLSLIREFQNRVCVIKGWAL